ncbi:trichohyalin-like [Mercenaria mercenaria]|uniref:trichohyalin-like n=1 Tax=Mercenaria mercenaria TaxID=6596 RepID=UPI00234F7327|nr:trichohyalin-like [Mercenaria mercenaria]
MRRTIHFYVMVTSLYLLRLKGARSDYTENSQDFDVEQKGQNYSAGLISTCSRLILDDLNLNADKLYDGSVNELNLSVHHETDLWVSITNSMYIKSAESPNTKVTANKEVEIRPLDQQPAYMKIPELSSVCPQQRKFSSNRQSVNQYESDVQRPAVRRAVYRHETRNRRRNASPIKEMNTRREMRVNNIRTDERRRLNIRIRSMIRRADSHRENHDRMHRRQVRRLDEVDNQRYDAKRRDQRNILSSDIRKQRDRSLSARQVRSDERRQEFISRKRVQRKDFTENSDARQERRENRRVQDRRPTRSFSIRQERRENDVIRENDMQSRTRNSEEVRRNTHFRSSSNNRRVAEERRENIVTSNFRGRDDVVRRESERSLNIKAHSDRRRVDDIRINTKRDKSVRFRHDVQYSISRDKSDLASLDEGRRHQNSNRRYSQIRRSEGSHDTGRSVIRERHADNTRQIPRLNVRGMGYKTATYGNFWSLDEGGISRAILVGFVGILGRKLWQKQA